MVGLLWLVVSLFAFAHAFWFDENLYFLALFAFVFVPDTLDKTLLALRLQFQGYANALRGQLTHLLKALWELPGVAYRLCAQGLVHVQRRARVFLRPRPRSVSVRSLVRRLCVELACAHSRREGRDLVLGLPDRFVIMHAATIRSATPASTRSAQASPHQVPVAPDMLQAFQGREALTGKPTEDATGRW